MASLNPGDMASYVAGALDVGAIYEAERDRLREVNAELVDACARAAVSISSEWCSHDGKCSGTTPYCFSSVLFAAIDKAEALR